MRLLSREGINVKGQRGVIMMNGQTIWKASGFNAISISGIFTPDCTCLATQQLLDL
jgi:hypothetical protein